ncbi:MAG: hypothetical protein WA110_02235, partial [Anaerolineaceae bacterium]
YIRMVSILNSLLYFLRSLVMNFLRFDYMSSLTCSPFFLGKFNPLSTTRYRPPAISYPLSATRYQLSTTRYPLSATRYQLPAISYQLPALQYNH